MSHHNYLIDLIIPTKDEEKYIGGTLDGLFEQTLYKRGLVRIIIADYSPYDKITPTQEVINKYNQTHIKIINIHQRGIPTARNLACKAGDAPIIVSFDADAKYDRNDGLELLVLPILNDMSKKNSDNTKKRLSVCSVSFSECDDVFLKASITALNGLMSLNTTPLGIGSAMAFSRDVYNEVGGFTEQVGNIDVNNVVGEDFNFAFKVCMKHTIFSRIFVKNVTVLVSDRRHSKLLSKGLEIFDYSKQYR